MRSWLARLSFNSIAMIKEPADVTPASVENIHASRIAVLIPSLDGGGAERSMLNLVHAFLERGRKVDLVLCRAKGAYLKNIPAQARLVVLESAGDLGGRLAALLANPGRLGSLIRPVILPSKIAPEIEYLRSLQRYLRERQPDVVLSALTYANLIALWAKNVVNAGLPVVVWVQPLPLTDRLQRRGVGIIARGELRSTEKKLIQAGADEVDMVVDVRALLRGDLRAASEKVARVVEAAGSHPVKVILETALLSREEKVKACLLCKMAGADFVKTSTGFGHGGATLFDVALIRETVGPEMGIKASGGVKTADDAEQMIAAGATRIGASAGVKMVQGTK